MTAAFTLNSIAQVSALRIVDCLVEGTLITIFAVLLLKLARRQNSGTRFAIWFSTLIAIAVVPVIGGAYGVHRSAPIEDLRQPMMTVPGSWAVYLFGVWAFIAAWGVLRVMAGVWHLCKLQNNCVPLDTLQLDARLREALERNSGGRRVEICESDAVQVPTAIGLVRPAVVIPRWVMQELSPDEVNQILLHELAHLRRFDDWTNLAQKLVTALFFFHPAVWWIERKVSLEREMACDDAVLAETASPRAYAECLAHLAERTLIQRSLALAQAALGRIRHTSLRVAQILDIDRPAGKTWSWKAGVSLMAGCAVVLVLCTSPAPKLIAFQDSAPNGVARNAGVASIDAGIGGIEGLSQSTALGARPWNAMLQGQTAPVVRAIAKRTVNARHRVEPRRAVVAGSVSTPAANVVQKFAANATPLAFTETVFVVVEGGGPGEVVRPVYAIQVWRVMLLHQAVDPGSRTIPRKET